uniref:Uncharacterized protein n=1 Tax=Neogobius melanostomus TaxID=47308 RepID=A0A8C6UDC9_9GOBI
MAAVAREPGAAAVPPVTPPEPGPGTRPRPSRTSRTCRWAAPSSRTVSGQPNGPDRACTDRTLSLSPERSERFTALREGLGDRPEDRLEENPEDHPQEHPEPELRPGTHVRVALDHVIDDALVVSFRVGHKVFSGVLMDLSAGNCPYYTCFIRPVPAFPPTLDTQSALLYSCCLCPTSGRRGPSSSCSRSPAPAAEDPPPLFHQGAPYPPPLFLRDSYHTSLPQPPPRRIKRSRRRYGNSEEPTCMLVRLRPRQVLCDRCKGAAGPERPLAEVKRLRSDEPRPPRPRKEAGGGATRQAAARSSPRSTHSPAHRVLTRRISALTPPLTPPRVRLKPHRYRTDGEPQNQTRTRPGPKTRTPPPQTPRRTPPPAGLHPLSDPSPNL